MATRRCPHSHPRGRLQRFLVRWFVLNSMLAGVLALAWLVLRAGNKPSRLAYPCQQAAFATAAAAFGGPVVAAIVAIRTRVIGGLLTPRGIAVAGLGLVTTLCLWGYLSWTPAYMGPTNEAPPRYMAQIFNETDCPHDPVGDRFYCLDDLIEKMGANGLKLHESSVPSLTAGPDGIIASDDVVVVKINYQWSDRGGTNTDVLRGLIRRIVDHPDAFTGEIVVCENTQFAAASNFDRAQNNAQDTGQSPRDVVNYFQAQGYKVSQYIWTDLRYTEVDEYSTADMADGYVVYEYDSTLFGRVSYPKFETVYGSKISLKNGIWNEGTGYDRDRLKFINLPVLKSHHSTYGATAIVKHYMGVVTGYLNTNSHGSIQYGLMGALMAEIQPADLNILDAIWINANPYSGPSTSYAGATRTDRLLATQDPVAGDIWAVKNILIPAFEDNGYSPPWPAPSADPDNPASAFRQYLDRSMAYINAAGYDATNKLAQIQTVDVGPPGEASEPGGGGAPFRITRTVDGYDLTWSDPVRGGPVETYNLYRLPLDGSETTPECEAALGGATSAFLPTLPDGHAFLVVANSVVGDGSFGRNDNGAERPAPLPLGVCP